MRYVIIGAGAIGGVLGARLAQHSAEHPPLLIARGEHGAAIADAGLRLRSPDENLLLRVDTATTPDEVRLRADDVLVMTTKTHQAGAALLEWVDQPVYPTSDAGAADAPPVGTAGEVLPLFMALNGVESERIASRYFERVFAICVWLPAVHLVPGEVIVRMAPTSGMFIIGRYGKEADDEDRALLATIQDDWQRSTFVVHPVENVMRWKYSKLLSNLGNALQALLGTDGSAFDHLADRLREEAEQVFRLAGIGWATQDEEAALRGDLFHNRPVPGVSDDMGGSSWQSMARGSGSIETDFLNGEIAYLARSIGQRAPQNAVVQRLARQAAASGMPAGSMTVPELERLLARD